MTAFIVVATVVNLVLFYTSFRMMKSAYTKVSEAYQIGTTRERVQEFLVALDALYTAGERAKEVGRVMDFQVAKVTEFCDRFDGRTDYIMDAIASRAYNVVDYISDYLLRDVQNHLFARLETVIPDLIAAKVAKSSTELVVVNTIGEVDVALEIDLRHVNYPKLRKALVNGLAKLPIKGKPDDKKLATAYIDRWFGSAANFEAWWDDLGELITRQQIRGGLTAKAMPAGDKPNHLQVVN